MAHQFEKALIIGNRASSTFEKSPKGEIRLHLRHGAGSRSRPATNDHRTRQVGGQGVSSATRRTERAVSYQEGDTIGIRTIPMATIEGIAGKYQGRKGPLRFGQLTIGRESTNNLSFPGDVTLSRRHALIDYQEGLCVCSDLGSTNGTFIDDVLVYSANQFVPSGSVIKCGQQSFRITYDCKVASKPTPLQQLPPVSVVSLRLNEEKPKDSASEMQSAPAKAKPEWFGAGTTLRLHGFDFVSPLVYVGESHAAPRTKGLDGEPSLIIPSRSITKPKGTYQGVVDDSVPPSYWLGAYREFDPSGRYLYLQWISEGRQGEVRRDFPYLFLCGLERRLEEVKSSTETLQIIGVIKELIQNYGDSEFLRFYAEQALRRTWAVFPEEARFDTPCVQMYEWQDQAFSWGAACLASKGFRFTVEHALQWFDAHTFIFRQRIVGQRCLEEFRSLFKVSVLERWAFGFELSESHEKVDAPFAPLNPSLGGQGKKLSKRGAKEASILLDELKALADECRDALDSMARAIGKSADPDALSRSELFLPVALVDRPEFNPRLKRALLERAGGPLTSLNSLLEDSGYGTPPLGKAEIPFFAVCSKLGYVLEPDPRFGIVREGQSHNLLIEKSRSDTSTDPNPRFAAALRTHLIALRYGMGVTFKGTPEESEIATKFSLLPGEAQRISLLQRWLDVTVFDLKRVAIAEMPADFQLIASEHLIELALRNPSPKVIGDLRSVLVTWGWNERAILARLSEVHEPAVVSRHERSTEYSLPRTEPDPTLVKASLLDMNKVNARMLETAEVQRLLANVFTEDDEGSQSPSSIPSSGALDSLLKALDPGPIESGALLAIVSPYGFTVNSAIETLNEYALDILGEPLLEGDGPFIIDSDVLSNLTHG
jgi:pSer/pThr/pTyr-binding forkhead associated (FHA) protein